jgi:hypothetical protein
MRGCMCMRGDVCVWVCVCVCACLDLSFLSDESGDAVLLLEQFPVLARHGNLHSLHLILAALHIQRGRMNSSTPQHNVAAHEHITAHARAHTTHNCESYASDEREVVREETVDLVIGHALRSERWPPSECVRHSAGTECGLTRETHGRGLYLR